MKETLTIKEESLRDLAEKVLRALNSIQKEEAKVLFLDGDLGAGKTTFTKEIAEMLGVKKDVVHSPTFILKKEYKTEHPEIKKLIHIDAYRFETPEEGKVLRLEDDIAEKDSLIVIEWPSKLGYRNPDMVLGFSVVDDETREVTMEI